MPEDPLESSPTLLQPFFEALFNRDASGGSWLPALLEASPHGRASLEGLVDSPGWLETPLAVRAASGRLGCFEYRTAPPRRLLRWFIDHPDRLVWPDGAQMTRETTRLRQALLRDDPPGSQVRAQERARDLVATRSPLSPEWWRFEDMISLDCVLITDRLVVTVQGTPVTSPSPETEWYPHRTRMVRVLEAAKHLAKGGARASLLLSETSPADRSEQQLAAVTPESAPHLDQDEREEMQTAYLGNLTWDAACDAVGLARGSLTAPPA